MLWLVVATGNKKKNQNDYIIVWHNNLKGKMYVYVKHMVKWEKRIYWGAQKKINVSVCSVCMCIGAFVVYFRKRVKTPPYGDKILSNFPFERGRKNKNDDDETEKKKNTKSMGEKKNKRD